MQYVIIVIAYFVLVYVLVDDIVKKKNARNYPAALADFKSNPHSVVATREKLVKNAIFKYAKYKYVVENKDYYYKILYFMKKEKCPKEITLYYGKYPSDAATETEYGLYNRRKPIYFIVLSVVGILLLAAFRIFVVGSR